MFFPLGGNDVFGLPLAIPAGRRTLKGEMGMVQGIFVLDPRKLFIDIEIEIVIEIDFWQLSDFDIDFDGCRPSLGSPYEHLAIYNDGMIVILQRTKMPWPEQVPAHFRHAFWKKTCSAVRCRICGICEVDRE
jgi:hypothetical protein